MPACAGATARAASPAGGPRRPGSPQCRPRRDGPAPHVAHQPCRAHADRARRLLVHQRVFDQHAPARMHTQPRAQPAQHARVGFRPQMAEHRHVLDRQHRIEQVLDAQRAQHAQRIRARRIGEHDLAACQARDGREVVVLPADARLQPRQPVRVVQEVRRLHAVVAHQAEQRGAIASPVLPAQRIGLVAREPELALHELGHRRVDARHRGRTRVVQRVVEVE